MSRSQPAMGSWFSGVFTAALWASLEQAAMAQGSSSKTAYALSYTIVLVFIAGAVYVVTRGSRRQESERSGGIDVGDFLPGQHAPVAAKRTLGISRTRELSPDAKLAMTLGIAGLVLFGVPGVFGIIKGIQARKTIKQNPRLMGENQAVTGIIAGAAGLVLWLIIGVIVLMNMGG